MLRYFTSGESHGKQLTVIIEGIPAGLEINTKDINNDLIRRQMGFGRGDRVKKIEKDKVDIVSGVRWGQSIGSPITLIIKNADWENNKLLMSENASDYDKKQIQLRPRPGHADLAGLLKFNREDLKDILERASARETAARVGAGAVFKRFLDEFGIRMYSFTRQIGSVKSSLKGIFIETVIKKIEKSPVRTHDKAAEIQMIKQIQAAVRSNDTIGGIFTIVAKNVPVGLGSHTQWDLKLDARIAQSLMSIQAIKGVEFGLGFQLASTLGSSSHDEIFYNKKKGFYRTTNNAGGFEGGITNGQDIVVSCVMKPIPSLKKPLKSINIHTKKQAVAEAIRSDICAVPSAGVIGEAAVSFELARSIKEKFGGDSLNEIKRNFSSYLEQIRKF